MQLLQHFKELTIRPKNAKELKGLILQLAIQGKLSSNWREENPDTETSSELLNRIQKEKEQLVKDKKINKEKSLPKLNKDEIPYKIPSYWTWCRLRDSGFTQTGSTPPKKNLENYGDFIPFIGPADISNYSMEYPVSGLSELGISVGRLIPKDSIMMVCIGGSIGKCNINEIDVSCNQQINTLTPILVPSVYIKVICQSPYFQKSVIDKASGSATPIINKGKWEMLPIPIPPLEEQKEIVKVVETLFKEVEQLEQLTVKRIGLKESFVASALHQLTTNYAKQEWTFLQEHFKNFFNETTNIKKLRETVLQLAVQGKLTADWRVNNPNTEDASQLLKRIQKEKAQLIKDKKIKKEKALPPITKEEIPYDLPDGWVWCRFGDLITFLNGYAFKSSTYVPLSEYQIIRLGNVKNDNFLINTKEAYVPESIGKETLAYQLYKDDILTTLTGTKDKRDYCYTCLVKDEHLEDKVLLLNQRVGCIRAIDKSSSELLNKFLKSEIILNQLFETETGTANQGNIGSTSFKNLVFPFPPLEEQKAIVEKVNALMDLCDALEQEVQQSQEHSMQLMQSVLREVFEPNNAN